MKSAVDVTGLAFFLAFLVPIIIWIRKVGVRRILRHPVGRIMFGLFLFVEALSGIRQASLFFGPSFVGIDLYRVLLFSSGVVVALAMARGISKAPIGQRVLPLDPPISEGAERRAEAPRDPVRWPVQGTRTHEGIHLEQERQH